MSHSLIAACRAAGQGLRRKESSTWGRRADLARGARRGPRAARAKTAAIEASRACRARRGRGARRSGSSRSPARRPGEAVGLAPLELDHALEMGSEGREVVLRPGLDPGGLREARLAGELGDEVRGQLGLPVVGAAQGAEVGALSFGPTRDRPGEMRARRAEGGQEIADLGRDRPARGRGTRRRAICSALSPTALAGM